MKNNENKHIVCRTIQCDNNLLDSKHITPTNKKLYNIKLVECGDYIQIYFYNSKKLKSVKENDEFNLIKKNISNNCENNDNNKIFLNDENNSIDKNIEMRSIIRSKLQCQRIAKANMKEWKSFITLTFGDNITNVKLANKQFQYYRDKVKRVKKDFKYLCIPEFQKRGAVHYHLLTNIPCNSNLIPKRILKNLYNPINNTWKKLNYYDLKYWNNGFSSAEIITGEVKKIIGYIAKYMTKNIDNRLFNHHRYFYSQNLQKPKESFINIDKKIEKEYLTKKLKNKTIIYENDYLNPLTNEIINFQELI